MMYIYKIDVSDPLCCLQEYRVFGETRSGLSGSHDDDDQSEETESEGEVIAKVSSKVK